MALCDGVFVYVGVTVLEDVFDCEEVPDGVLEPVSDADLDGVTVIVLLGDAPDEIVAVGVQPGSNARPATAQ